MDITTTLTRRYLIDWLEDETAEVANAEGTGGFEEAAQIDTIRRSLERQYISVEQAASWFKRLMGREVELPGGSK